MRRHTSMRSIKALKPFWRLKPARSSVGILRIVRDWVGLRRLELAENWQCGRRGEPFHQVPGPDEGG